MESEDIVLKLLHTADWHLGRTFRSFAREGDAVRLGRARLEVLERVFGEAERNQVHAVLCAGDLFDGPNPSLAFREGLLALLRARTWATCPVFLLPGNHDPLVPDSVWRDPKFRAALPEGVHIVDRAPFEFALGPDAVLHAVPCQSSAGQADPTASIPQREQGDTRIRIGLVHGSTWDALEAQTNFPIARDAAVERGLDYLAVGDTHGFRFATAERTRAVTIYPGTPEPTAFDEVDAGFVALAYVTRQRVCHVEKAKVGRFSWRSVEVTSMAALRDLVARSDLAQAVVRVRLAMQVTPAEYDEAIRLIDLLRGTSATLGRVGVLDLDDSKLSLDVDQLDPMVAQLPEVVRAAAEQLKKVAREGTQRAAAERALYHLLRLVRAG